MRHTITIQAKDINPETGHYEIIPPLDCKAGDELCISIQGEGEAFEAMVYRFEQSRIGQVTGIFIPVVGEPKELDPDDAFIDVDPYWDGEEP